MLSAPAHFRKGFTLIEVVVVVVIIGVLSGVLISVIDPSEARSKARDSQRVASLKYIQTAVELYKHQNNTYPLAGTTWVKITGSDALSNLIHPAYMNSVPTDPLQAGSTSLAPCFKNSGSTPDYRFQYLTNTTGSFYLLTAQMEVESSAADSVCSSLSQWSNAGCSTANLSCYGLENKIL